MKKLLYGLVVLALLVPMVAFATEQEPPDPLCTWVDPVYKDVWVPPVMGEECELSCEGVGKWFFYNPFSADWKVWEYQWYFIPYNKEVGDTKHCHMPNASDLMNVYGMSNDEKTRFRAHYRDWKEMDGTLICTPVVIEEGYWTQELVSEGYWDCPDDICSNIEGIQVEVPDGYKKIGRRCVPAPLPSNSEFTHEEDCDGWVVLKNTYVGEQLIGSVVVDSGPWTSPKDVLEKIDVAGEGYEFTIFEPEYCYECVPEHVFVWFHEAGCNLRQRGGPIGGQTRPFIPMQQAYCYPCDIYPTDEGWTGRYINSCQKPDEYMYWNTLPQFNGCTGACLPE